MKRRRRHGRIAARVLSVLSVLLLSACATIKAPPPEERIPEDPWEGFNRNVYAFNRSVDKAILIPLARGYNYITPEPVERGIANFFNNLRSLPDIVNLLLQGQPGDAGRMSGRFFVNTVFGLAGFIDVATDAGLADYDEDFGQTLAVWGWEDSRYLMLPFLGPSTLRDAIGTAGDATYDIPWQRTLDSTKNYPLALDIVQLRANVLGREEDLEVAYDEYLLIRDAWLQRRAYKISGESATPDYEALLEEDPWDDEPPQGEDSGND